MASARYWRLVGISTYSGGDLELGGLHWYVAGVRADVGATLTCSHEPIQGALTNLQDTDPLTTARFDAAAVRSAGFWLRWEFAAAIADPCPRFLAVVRDRFIEGAILQYSSDGSTGWTTDVAFSRVIYPGDAEQTPADPIVRPDLVSQWDAASKGAGASISGRTASVYANLSGYVRTDAARSSGRRVFGLRLTAVTAPQTFFGGLAALVNWGAYNVGKHWSLYGHDGLFYYYPSGSRIALTPEPGAPTTVGDVAYFDVDLTLGTCAIKKNGGAWSAPVALPNFVAGAAYIIDLLAPSSSSSPASAALLTTHAELEGHIPAGATSWDASNGVSAFTESAPIRSVGAGLRVAASAVVPPFTAGSSSKVSLARDVEHGGRGTIYGTTKIRISDEEQIPTRARVVLVHQRSKQPVRETWSDPITGGFAFEGIDTAQEFLTLAEDATGSYRPVAANRLTPEVLA